MIDIEQIHNDLLQHSLSLIDEEELILFLEKIVNIWSPSKDGKANDSVQHILKEFLEAIGFKVQLINHEEHPGLGKLLVAEYLGEKREFITMVMHSDVVIANPEFKGFERDKKNNLAYGPGVSDCKGGIVVALYAVKAFLEIVKKPQFSLRIVCSPAEETGSKEFHHHLKKYGEDSEMILGYEPSLEDGSIVRGRSGNRWYKITVRGRTAHSGRHFDRGVNAAEALAHKLIKISQLTDFDKGTTVATTYISGGKRNYNTIPEEVVAYVDTRFVLPEENKRLEKSIKMILNEKDVHAISDNVTDATTVEVVDYCSELEPHRNSQHYLDYYQKIVETLEKREIQEDFSHGSADCNSILHGFLVFLGGLGAVGSGIHTTKETICLDYLVSRVKASAYLLLFCDRVWDEIEKSVAEQK